MFVASRLFIARTAEKPESRYNMHENFMLLLLYSQPGLLQLGAIPTLCTYKSNWNVISVVKIAPLALLSLFAYSIKIVVCT